MKPEICGCGDPILVATTLHKRKVKLNPRPQKSGTWVFDVGLNRILQVVSGTYERAYEEHRPFCLKARK